MICASLRSFKSCSLCIASLRGPPIGGQDNDGVPLLCSAPYTLLPLRGISPQGETRNLRRKTESHILHVPVRHSPFGGWRHHLVRWEACLWILSRLRLPANPVPFPPQAGHYKSPLCYELLMKGLLCESLLSTVHILHRMCKSGEVRRLACP